MAPRLLQMAGLPGLNGDGAAATVPPQAGYMGADMQ